MQIASAFGRVQDSLSWFVENYSTLAAWRATVDRLTSFDDAISTAGEANPDLQDEAHDITQGYEYSPGDLDDLHLGVKRHE